MPVRMATAPRSFSDVRFSPSQRTATARATIGVTLEYIAVRTLPMR